MFEQGEDVEREETQTGRDQQTGLLDGQHRCAIRRQRVNGCVCQSVPSITEAGRHRAVHGYTRQESKHQL